MTSRFDGRKALVTGAGSGFGRETAIALAREGATDVVLVERAKDRLEAACAEVESHGARAIGLAVDLGDTESVMTVVETALSQVGGLDILISNHAAMSWEVPFLDGTDADWQRELDISLTSHYILARETARSMRDGARGGSIAFTSSVNALGAEHGYVPYCVTKSALTALTKAMAVELAEYGIRVNCVSPGPADTQRSVELVGEEMMAAFRRDGFAGIPLVRLASVVDIAEAFLYLASDAAAYITGHNLIVDGGLTAFAYHLPKTQA